MRVWSMVPTYRYRQQARGLAWDIITEGALILRNDTPTPGDTDGDEDPLALRAHRAKAPSSLGPAGRLGA